MDFILRLNGLADAERRNRFRGVLSKLESKADWFELDVPVLDIVAADEPGAGTAVERMRGHATGSGPASEAYFWVGPLDRRDWAAQTWADFELLAPYAYAGHVVGSGFVGDFADSADHLLLSADLAFPHEVGLDNDVVPWHPRRRWWRRLWARAESQGVSG